MSCSRASSATAVGEAATGATSGGTSSMRVFHAPQPEHWPVHFGCPVPQSLHAWTVLILVMAILDSTRVFRVSRAIASDLAVMDFVEVARLRGEGWFWIIRREILPNAWSPLLAEFGLRFAFAVIFLSTLSFLGLGIQPPEADWGGLVLENKDGLLFGVTAALVPGLAIAVLAVAVNLVVDWLINRAADPRGERPR